MNTFFRRHRLIVLLVLAFALSWYPWVVGLIRGRASGPNPLGSFVAAIIVIAIAALILLWWTCGLIWLFAGIAALLFRPNEPIRSSPP